MRGVILVGLLSACAPSTATPGLTAPRNEPPGAPCGPLDREPAGALAELLEQLSARLAAPSSIVGRTAQAASVATAHVAAKRIRAHLASPALLADEAIVRSYVRDEDNGPTVLVRVVELAIDSWLIGGTGTTAVVVWPAQVVSDPRGPVLPAVKDRGLVFLAAHPDDVLGRELRAAFPDSYGIGSETILVHADVSDELRDALALWGRADPAEAAQAVGAARGERLQLALDVLVRAGAAGRTALEQLRAGTDGTRALLVRAALWRAGAHDAAASGLSSAALNREALTPLGVGRIEEAGQRRFSGPPIDTPIGW